MKRRLSGRINLAAGVLAAFYLLSRVVWYVGLGLNDDLAQYSFISKIVENRRISDGPLSYRFAWWLPTTLSCHAFGLSELGMILPVTLAAVAAIALVWMLGDRLYGKAGGLLAAAIVSTLPLDFAWSTMLTVDVVMSMYLSAMFLLIWRALERRERGEGEWAIALRWLGAGLSLWLAIHTKLSALFAVPAVIAVLIGRSLPFSFLLFPAVALSLLSADAVWNLHYWGDALHPLTNELDHQGLSAKYSFENQIVTSHTLLVYFKLLFWPNHLGDLAFGIAPHVALLLAVLAPFLKLRARALPVWWLGALFLGMELNIQSVEGVWVAGFRNVRYAHPWIAPLSLILSGFLLSMHARWPRAAACSVFLLLIANGWQSVSLAKKMKDSFEDRRAVVDFFSSRQVKLVYGDFQIGNSLKMGPNPRWDVQYVHMNRRDRQRAELEEVEEGYLVTGGGREPYYGCHVCIPRAAEVSEYRWRLIYERPGFEGPSPWRTEPVRIWEAKGAPGATGFKRRTGGWSAFPEE